jgi:hypothetical protein
LGRRPADMLSMEPVINTFFDELRREFRSIYGQEYTQMNPEMSNLNPDRAHIGPWNLIWVTKDMAELLQAAVESVPTDDPLGADIIPFWENTLVAFAEQIEAGEDVTRPIPVRAITWHMTSNKSTGKDAVVFFTFDEKANTGLGLWEIGTPPVDAIMKAAMPMQIIRMTIALWLLMTQPGITDTNAAHVDRAAIRRAHRAGRDPRVRIVDLRHSHGSGTATGRTLSKRFMVRGHWRQQVYGKGRTLRRPTWIAPHIKGPDDAPLDTRPTVYRLGTG